MNFWIPAPRFRGDRFRGNDNNNICTGIAAKSPKSRICNPQSEEFQRNVGGGGGMGKRADGNAAHAGLRDFAHVFERYAA